MTMGIKENKPEVSVFGDMKSCAFIIGRTGYGIDVRFYLKTDDHPLAYEKKGHYYLGNKKLFGEETENVVCGKSHVVLGSPSWCIMFVVSEKEKQHDWVSVLTAAIRVGAMIDDLYEAGRNIRSFFEGEMGTTPKPLERLRVNFFDTEYEIDLGGR